MYIKNDDFKVKDYLYQLRIADVKINNKLLELEKLKLMAHTLGGSDFSERVQSSRKTEDKIADKIIKIIDFEREINSDIDKYVDLKANVIKIIDKIENSEYLDLIYKRYIHNKSWTTIADEMKYSEKHIYKIHGKALKEVEKIIMDTK